VAAGVGTVAAAASCAKATDLQPKTFVFDFEFRQLVLAHEIQKLFQLVQIH